jgi:hypothetical protein
MPIRTLPNLPAPPHPCSVIEMSSGIEFGGPPFCFTLRLIRTSNAWLCFCPRCGRRAAVLYFPPGSTEPNSAAAPAYGSVFESQYQHTPACANYIRAIVPRYLPQSGPAPARFLGMYDVHGYEAGLAPSSLSHRLLRRAREFRWEP